MGEVISRHNNLRGISTERQICFQILESKNREFDIAVSFLRKNSF